MQVMWKSWRQSFLIMDSEHVILSAVQPETIAARLDKDIAKEDNNVEE